LRLTQQDLERLEALSKSAPELSKTALAQKALRLGLEALEQQQPQRRKRPAAESQAQVPAPDDPDAQAEEPNSSRRANLQRLKTRLDRLETQVQEFFDSQATDTNRARTKKKS
jgi:hypothetical protein